MNNLAFIFPGQGSQSREMLKNDWQNEVVMTTFEEADEALGFSLSHIIKEGSGEELGRTEITQPAILTVSVALYRLYEETSEIKPQLMAGHSLGEYSALVAAQSLEFTDAVKLVHKRGQFMQEAVPEGQGAMAAILGLEDEVIIALCEEISKTSGVVAAVNFNSPGQVVIAGEKEAVLQASEEAKVKGARRALPLPVSVPSHSILMKPAAEKLATMLETMTLKIPKISIIHNVDVASHDSPEAIKQALVAQLYQPVRWTETIQTFKAHGIENLVECGPGKVLTGLTRRIDKTLTSYNLFEAAHLDELKNNLSK